MLHLLSYPFRLKWQNRGVEALILARTYDWRCSSVACQLVSRLHPRTGESSTVLTLRPLPATLIHPYIIPPLLSCHGHASLMLQAALQLATGVRNVATSKGRDWILNES